MAESSTGMMLKPWESRVSSGRINRVSGWWFVLEGIFNGVSRDLRDVAIFVAHGVGVGRRIDRFLDDNCGYVDLRILGGRNEDALIFTKGCGTV